MLTILCNSITRWLKIHFEKSYLIKSKPKNQLKCQKYHTKPCKKKLINILESKIKYNVLYFNYYEFNLLLYK